MANPFKKCSLCNVVWQTKEEFLEDKSVELNGYQFTTRNRTEIRKGGFLIFTHHTNECGTTLAIIAENFKEHQ